MCWSGPRKQRQSAWLSSITILLTTMRSWIKFRSSVRRQWWSGTTGSHAFWPKKELRSNFERQCMINSSNILKAKILIVDDQKANVLLLERMLRDASYACIASTMDPLEVSV